MSNVISAAWDTLTSEKFWTQVAVGVGVGTIAFIAASTGTLPVFAVAGCSGFMGFSGAGELYDYEITYDHDLDKFLESRGSDNIYNYYGRLPVKLFFAGAEGYCAGKVIDNILVPTPDKVINTNKLPDKDLVDDVVKDSVQDAIEDGISDSAIKGTSGSKSWYNKDGSINYPPNNGAVAGTESTISLKPGDTLGRYGNIGEKSNFVTRPGADASKLSLPPTTNPNIYQEFVVVKEIPQTIQSKIAAWGDSVGGGVQYELPMPIKELIRKGYIVPK